MSPSNNRFVTGSWNNATPQFRDDRLLVSVRPGAHVAATLEAVRQSAARELENLNMDNPPGRRWAVLEFSPLADAATRIPALAARLAAIPELRYAEPDFLCVGHSIPNDPLYRKQVWPQMLGFEDAWKHSRGARRITVGIADSGIAIPPHDDVKGIRYRLGHDYTGGIFLMDPIPGDKHGHGTNVTAIAAASTHNSLGLAGANWNSPVYVTRVLDDSLYGSASGVKRGVLEIVEHGTGPMFAFDVFGLWPRHVVINLSLGSSVYADSLLQMCEETDGGDVVLCVAAGRSTTSPSGVDYPAHYARTFKHVIAVGDTNFDDEIKSPNLTDYHPITIFAPGEGILSAVPPYVCTMNPDGSLRYSSDWGGTSQACPIVTGVVSLMWSARPGLTPEGIKQRLLEYAVQIADDAGIKHPRLNVFGLVRRPWWWWWVFWM